IVAQVAEALFHAHRVSIYHRDIKPENILLDAEGFPTLVDFGLALQGEEWGKGPAQPGTPCYMSPEQSTGQGNRIDGRSDVFSLGIVFYELLGRERPFRGNTTEELFEQI